ncbi:hypothetical protein BDN70DRAFT_887062 [Pholiota conissans]|uniref:Uncharacterized protein n=1 Tax=Pholiota conissans TaxID=109636 RepID=A0A9P5YM71_9AGAR|nr:hypothetical protein BDN70DRAFT_887062 [Pholiota conissans]
MSRRSYAQAEGLHPFHTPWSVSNAQHFRRRIDNWTSTVTLIDLFSFLRTLDL